MITICLCRERLSQIILNPSSLTGEEKEPQPAVATVAECTEHAEAQWQKVLLALVEGKNAPLRPHKDLSGLSIRKVFVAAGLLDEAAELTESGFKFLFRNLQSQVWFLLEHYLAHSSQEEGTQLASAMSFLLQLSLTQVTHSLNQY